MDAECVSLSTAINKIIGLQTIESCCGHGERPFKIWFVVDDPEDLPILLYYCDPCHVDFRWNCCVITDCAMSPVTFKLVSETLGADAYEQAERIAKEIEQCLLKKERHEKAEDEQLALLPERARRAYPTSRIGWVFGSDGTMRELVKYLCDELARTLTPLPCGHPPGCVVSASSAEGMDTTSHCGWCAVETDLAGSIEFNRDVATENLKLEAERDAVIERLDEQETHPDYLCNALRAQLNKAEEAIKRYRKDLKMLREKLKAADKNQPS